MQVNRGKKIIITKILSINKKQHKSLLNKNYDKLTNTYCQAINKPTFGALGSDTLKASRK